MEEDNEVSVKSRIESNNKKAALNRAILAKRAAKKLELQAKESSVHQSGDSEVEEKNAVQQEVVIALVERSGVDGGGGGGRLEEREGGWGDKGGQEQPDEVLLKNTKINTAQTSSLTKI